MASSPSEDEAYERTVNRRRSNSRSRNALSLATGSQEVSPHLSSMRVMISDPSFGGTASQRPSVDPQESPPDNARLALHQSEAR